MFEYLVRQRYFTPTHDQREKHLELKQEYNIVLNVSLPDKEIR